MYKQAYNIGFEAGISIKPLMVNADGTKTLVLYNCPFKPWQLIKRYFWHEGYHKGLIERSNRWRMLSGANCRN